MSHCRAKETSSRLLSRPKVPLQGRQGSRVAFQTHPRSQASSRGEAKDSTLLSSGDVQPLEPTEWPKMSQASCGVCREDWDCSPGHAETEGPHLLMMAASRGFSRAAAPVWVFLRGTTGSSGSLSCGANEIRSPCPWRGVACHCYRVMIGESGLKMC